MIVTGSLLALIAVGAVVVGGYGLWLHTTQRSDGYVMTSGERFATGSYALATRTLHIGSGVPGFLYGRDWLGDVRIRGASADATLPLFIGIARKEDVDRYLAGVAHGRRWSTSVRARWARATGRATASALAAGPRLLLARRGFWVASVAGRGAEALTWSVRQGHWAVVVMRPDGSRGVSADLAAGAKLPALLWASIAVLAFGLLTLSAAAALVYFGVRPRPGPTPSVAGRTDG